MDLFVNIIAHILVVALPGIVFIILLLCFICDLQCTVVGRGKCVEIGKTGRSSNVYYRIKFSYSYNSKKYERYCTKTFRRYPKKFIEGEIYPIYINPRYPEIFRCAKKRHLIFDGAILTFMGLITIVGMIGLIKKIIELF